MNSNKVIYDATVATSYDADREGEDHWTRENEFIKKYFETNFAVNILDLPVGTGRFLPFYPAQSNVLGVDISEHMLEQSRLKLPGAAVKSVALQIADAESLNFVETASIDVIVCFRLMHLIKGEKRLEVFKEFGRVLRGELLLQLYISTPKKPFIFRALAKMKGWLRKGFTKHDSAFKPWSHIESYSFSEQDIREGCMAGNLKVVNRTRLCNYYGQEVCVLSLRKI